MILQEVFDDHEKLKEEIVKKFNPLYAKTTYLEEGVPIMPYPFFENEITWDIRNLEDTKVSLQVYSYVPQTIVLLEIFRNKWMEVADLSVPETITGNGKMILLYGFAEKNSYKNSD